MEQLSDLFDNMTTAWFKGTLGTPTDVQKEAWPAIASGENVLVSAPTGTGKTLSAFLIFIDRLMKQARLKTLPEELVLIYISPLKSLAGDIRENLRRPLNGILEEQLKNDSASRNMPSDIHVSIRTGDTKTSERQSMIKHPPHILITTPESFYLLLTSMSGQKMLKTAKAIIIDELHSMIDTKRGAHLMLSIARLDKLCGRRVQRIALSATIEPLGKAAEYMSSDNKKAVIVAPVMKKDINLLVSSPRKHENAGTGGGIWEELAEAVYEHCIGARTVIAFVDGRMYAEKLAFYINKIAGEGFARTHHGSLSKEQRHEVEEDLRAGKLRLLCATSSMELGIDVGDVDRVFQIGCPPSVSGTLQRLGRAGHNPGRVSVMHIFPRTATEGFYCGLMAELTREGMIEQLCPPHLCLDILAQHLVSMATGDGYAVDEVMELLADTYPFHDVTREDVKSVLCMLAGDYEHENDIPVRPRVLYDRIHERVEGDAYSRMLAVSAGGTIPDKGMYPVKTASGIKLGELDEEFVFEAHIGDKFMLGTFAWKLVSVKKDVVIVEPASLNGAQLPFWKGEPRGRKLQIGRAYGELLRGFRDITEYDALIRKLLYMGLDEAAAERAADFIERQRNATGILPDDKTIIIEHFHDETGNYQMMVHSIFGRSINGPLAILVKEMAERIMETNVNFTEDDDGFLLYPYGEKDFPEGIIKHIRAENARQLLEAILPSTPLFNMNFRYNAAHALMMGVRKTGRQPLWVQRMRSSQMMDTLLQYKNHPLIRETTRECLEDCWDIPGVEQIISLIQSGDIEVLELYQDNPSPMSIGLRRQAESIMMYDYSPTPLGVHVRTSEAAAKIDMITPGKEQLTLVGERKKLPEDEKQLHSLLMIEGDLIAGELDIPIEWLEKLIQQEQAMFIEPGLWIAAEQEEEYRLALTDSDSRDASLYLIDDLNNSSLQCKNNRTISRKEKNTDKTVVTDTRQKIVRRVLRYRGPQSIEQITERYLWSRTETESILLRLCENEEAVQDSGLFYHGKLYEKARWETVKERRRVNRTYPASSYAALLLDRQAASLPPEKEVERTIEQFRGYKLSSSVIEETILSARVRSYRADYLDKHLAQGQVFFKVIPSSETGKDTKAPSLDISFNKYDDFDWDADISSIPEELKDNERLIYCALAKRGASFMQSLSGIVEGVSPYDTLLSLVRKGYVCADSFLPVRQCLSAEKVSKSLSMRHHINQKVAALSSGRFEISRPIRRHSDEEILEHIFDCMVIVSRETVNYMYMNVTEEYQLTWAQALELLRIWEYTGKVRRGYFIEGMSGIQFISAESYTGTMSLLEKPEYNPVWIPAVDPALSWGKYLPHIKGHQFMNIRGTVVGLIYGIPRIVFERQGQVMRVFDGQVSELVIENEENNKISDNGSSLREIKENNEDMFNTLIKGFIESFKQKRIYGTLNRIVIKDYPKRYGDLLKAAGFMHEIQDYVFYR